MCKCVNENKCYLPFIPGLLQHFLFESGKSFSTTVNTMIQHMADRSGVVLDHSCYCLSNLWRKCNSHPAQANGTIDMIVYFF